MRRSFSQSSLACLLAIRLCSCGGDPAQGTPSHDQAGGTSKLQSAGLAPGLDAGAEGWSTETLGDMAKSRLTEVAELGTSPTAKELSSYCAPEAVSQSLRLPSQTTIRDRDGFLITRGGQPGERAGTGPAGLALALRELYAPFDARPRIQIKTTSVALEDESAAITRILYQAFGRSIGRPFQQSSNWEVKWDTETDRILSIAAVDYEEVHGPADASTLFTDHTQGVFKDEIASARQFLPSLSHLAASVDTVAGPQINSFEGVAVGDVNGDGYEDVFFSQAIGLPNKLYVQRRDGSLRDVSQISGVDMLAQTTASLLVDLDGDGDQDLVTSGSSLMIFENTGNADDEPDLPSAPALEVRLELAITSTYSLSAADYDLDRDLDLYICRYNDTQSAVPTPYHDANNGPPNLLLRNDGAWGYTDATEEAGLNHNNTRYSFAASWTDYDSDGDPDLYVANDFGRNNLYENRAGRFIDVANDLGVEDISAGMSADWGDPDSDGDYDIYVGNMYSAAGNRIAFQRQFQPDASEDKLATLKRHARGNTLFLRGESSFTDTSINAGVTMGRWSWCSRFIDIDNDSMQDIVVLNGNITSEDATHDL